jgi:hypothetical protein
MSESRKSSEKDNRLYQRVDEVLHYLWDPIGIARCPGARDEYYSYLPQVFSMLKQGCNEEKIADYLGKVTSLSMGMGTNKERDLQIGRILVDWRDAILD